MQTHKIEIPDGSSRTVDVPEGQDRYDLGDGRALTIEWVETYPAQPGRIRIVQAPQAGDLASGLSPADVAIGLMKEAASWVAKIEGMSPRDRNAVIGQARNLAAQIRGFGGLSDWPTVPFR